MTVSCGQPAPVSPEAFVGIDTTVEAPKAYKRNRPEIHDNGYVADFRGSIGHEQK